MKKWNIKPNGKLKIKNGKLDRENLIKILLQNRGIKTKKDIEDFLHPDLENVTIESVDINKKELNRYELMEFD